MKKTIINIGEGYREVLYIGIKELYGGFLLETEGDPLTLNTLEDNDEEELIKMIDSTIKDDGTPWDECDDKDTEYIKGWLVTWGIEDEDE
jgi:hypothetical protein